MGVKDSAYYERENLIKDIEDLNKNLNPFPSAAYLKALNEITFNGLPLQQITLSQLRTELGTPTSSISNTDQIKNHRIHFYRDSLGMFRILSQYHFIGNEFIFASNRFSSQSRLSQDDKNQIVGQVQKKYLGESVKSKLNKFDFKFKDELNNRLFIDDDVHFYLNYIPGSEFVKNLSEKLTEFDMSNLDSQENIRVLRDLI